MANFQMPITHAYAVEHLRDALYVDHQGQWLLMRMNMCGGDRGHLISTEMIDPPGKLRVYLGRLEMRVVDTPLMISGVGHYKVAIPWTTMYVEIDGEPIWAVTKLNRTKETHNV